MILSEIADKARALASKNPPLGYSIKINFNDEGNILWDGTGDETVITENSDADADTTLSMSLESFEKLTKGDLDATIAYMTGKLKIEGSMGVAMKLAAFFGD